MTFTGEISDSGVTTERTKSKFMTFPSNLNGECVLTSGSLTSYFIEIGGGHGRGFIVLTTMLRFGGGIVGKRLRLVVQKREEGRRKSSSASVVF
ncbi:hypothetical protein L195_g058112 [Trifolium pratense]|uniref:Uncharacterized protein n=1 Tax=Trifolium pratense TaxID=57577 RepID=A0A2K3JQC7_TRIPR|nr:hypothetical protein L195_g058112 [Trifolium pratense]